MPKDDFLISLAVGVKDLYSKKIREIEAAGDSLRQKTERLQKTIGDISAYQKAEAEVEKLAAKEARLGRVLAAVQARRAKLQKEIKALAAAVGRSGRSTEEDKKRLAALERQLAETSRQEGVLKDEIRRATRSQDQQIRSLKTLSQGLKKTGLDTKDLAKDLDRLQDELKQVNQELEKTEKVKGFAELKDKLGAGALGAAAGGFLFGLAKGAYGLEASVRKLIATTELTEEKSRDIEEVFLDVQKETGRGYEEIGAGAQRLIQQLKTDAEDLAPLLSRTFRLEDLYGSQGLDQAEIVKALGQMKNAWRDLSEEEGLDLMAVILAEAGDKAGDLMDTLWEYSPIMKEAGLSAQQFAAMLIRGAQEGAYNYDKLGDAIKESYKARLTDVEVWDRLVGKGGKKGLVDELLSGDEAGRIKTYLAQIRHGMKTGDAGLKTKAYSQLLISLSDIYEKDAQAARNLVEQIFGTMGAEDLTGEVLRAMGEGLSNPVAVLGEWQGRLKKQIKEGETAWDRLAVGWRGITHAVVGDTKEMTDALEPFIDLLAEGAAAIGDFLKEHPTLSKLAVGGVGAAGAGAAGMIGLGAVGWLLGGLKGGLRNIGGLFRRGGRGGAAGALGALAGGVVPVYVTNVAELAGGFGVGLPGGRRKGGRASRRGYLKKLASGAAGKRSGFLGRLASGVSGIFGKGLGKIGAKGVGKAILKKIPVIGLLAGLAFGAHRALAGDWTGAVGELASGAASLVPGVGTALSTAIDAALTAKDLAAPPATRPIQPPNPAELAKATAERGRASGTAGPVTINFSYSPRVDFRAAADESGGGSFEERFLAVLRGHSQELLLEMEELLEKVMGMNEYAEVGG